MEKTVEKLMFTIESAVIESYEEIKKQGKLLDGIATINKQVRFKNPELAEFIRKYMLKIAKEKGDLP